VLSVFNSGRCGEVQLSGKCVQCYVNVERVFRYVLNYLPQKIFSLFRKCEYVAVLILGSGILKMK
jgi:hypothetical protein